MKSIVNEIKLQASGYAPSEKMGVFLYPSIWSVSSFSFSGAKLSRVQKEMVNAHPDRYSLMLSPSHRPDYIYELCLLTGRTKAGRIGILPSDCTKGALKKPSFACMNQEFILLAASDIKKNSNFFKGKISNTTKINEIENLYKTKKAMGARLALERSAP